MPSRFNRVFVVTYGRSGSTLLQGLLNAIPGYRIYGENAGFLTKLHDAHTALADANENLRNPANDTPLNAWFGSSRYDPATLTAAFRDFVDRILFRPADEPNVHVFGFKEIKYNDLGSGKLTEFLSFVRNIYPNSAIIFNTRRLDDVLTSGWWRNNIWSGLSEQLSDFDEFAKTYAIDHADHAIHIRYDALVDPDRREAARLLTFLGESLADDLLEAVFAKPYSYENRALTEYLAGRAGHIELLEHDWWRVNIDEFRINVEGQPGRRLAKGVFLRSVGSSARVTLRSGEFVAEVVGSSPTPRIGKLFASNPDGAKSGFSIRYPAADVLHLFGASDGFENRLIGVIRHGSTPPSDPPPGGQGAP